MEKHYSEDIIMEKHCSEDIVLEILTRLPAKSLMRFKCISKAWNTLIGHPNFAKLHKARSQARLLFELEVEPHFWKFRPHYKKYPTRKRRRLEGCSLELTGPYHYFNYDEMSICSNHCNGLVCLYSFKDTQAYLYNVATGEIKALPFSVNPEKYPEFFLGFDMVTEKYKLLHVFVKRNKGIPRIKSRILTLGINSWRKIIMPPNFFCVRPEGCIFLDGVLYPIYKPVTYFNFREEEFGNLPHIQHSIFSLNIMQTALSKTGYPLRQEK
ncbi:F-box protein At2g15640-like [Lycium ferocissimum]|uniref:F-box protein At2g15640-like n=1 Tax=Lycium ferocissimum TaxID=112874 RepID=UPI002814EED0|nr:F-box protein At2g15640-like [Lycium ferocissimum]